MQGMAGLLRFCSFGEYRDKIFLYLKFLTWTCSPEFLKFHILLLEFTKPINGDWSDSFCLKHPKKQTQKIQKIHIFETPDKSEVQ